MWTIESRPCKLYDAHDTAIGLELEEAFILNVGRTGRIAVEALGNQTSSSPERGWRFAGLQIPSMAYPPSSTVSYFNHICIIYNPNDWLIVDGVFFVIRSIILLGNKTILQDGRRSSVWRLRILSFSVWDADC